MILVKWLMAMSRKKRDAGATPIPAPLFNGFQAEMLAAINAATGESRPPDCSLESKQSRMTPGEESSQ